MFNNIKGKGVILFVGLFVIYSLSNNVFSENIKIKSASKPSKKIRIIARQGHPTSTPYMLNGNAISKSHIIIEQSGSQNVEIGILGTGTLSTRIPMTKSTDDDLAPIESQVKKKKRYEGVSISKTSGAPPTPVLNGTPKIMKQVTNLGKPQGVNAKARSVKSEVKYSDSPRMNKLKERKMKRREALKKKLEEKRKTK